MKRTVSGVLAGIAFLALAGCGDDLPTQPPKPLDVSGLWTGTASTQGLRYGCGDPEPVAATANFTQAGTRVTGTFAGACLDGATFEGVLQRQERLVGQTTFVGRFECSGVGATAGPGSLSRLTLNVRVVQNPFTGTCNGGPFGVQHGTLTLYLTR